MPGVFAVPTYEDVPDVLYGQLVKDRRLFARDRARFEGDIIAAVAPRRSRSSASKCSRSSRYCA
jgi:xanthine dehydrogenase molybdopterin-binding subunit B